MNSQLSDDELAAMVCAVDSLTKPVWLHWETNGGVYLGGSVCSEHNTNWIISQSHIVNKEMMSDFVRRNRVVNLNNRPCFEGIIARKTNSYDDFKRPYATISTVGFDSSFLNAILYFDCLSGPTSGGGSWFVCSRESVASRWLCQEKIPLWDA